MRAIVKLTGMTPAVIENLQCVKTLQSRKMTKVEIEDFVVADNTPYLFIGDTTFAVNGSKLDCVTFE